MIINMPRENGRKVFQVRFINMSYRIRGRVARTQTKQNAIKVIFIVNKRSVKKELRKKKFRNRTVVKRLIIKIFRYSAMKMSAKVPLLNSTLNPETSSDSPSERSKGVRLVSARVVVNQIMNMIISINM